MSTYPTLSSALHCVMLVDHMELALGGVPLKGVLSGPVLHVCKQWQFLLAKLMQLYLRGLFRNERNLLVRSNSQLHLATDFMTWRLLKHPNEGQMVSIRLSSFISTYRKWQNSIKQPGKIAH